ncbi:MAG: phosphoenolpyruvate--protein phosphotransferase, partial [Rhodospirillaceae bacterium]|nr:phosphoenolpyruvate--protein phosphotransferase [Rhodospirillaceae bacterium]
MKNRKTRSGPEMTFSGMAVGVGVAIGVIYRHDSHASVHVREETISAAKVRSEQHRLLEAAARAAGHVEKLQNEAKRMQSAAGEEIGYLLDAYHQMLSGSRLIRGVQKRIATDQVNAETAVMREIGLMVEAFATMDDRYLAARVDDIREVGRRLVESLTGKKTRALSNLPKNAVIVADELSPADTATLDPGNVAGLVTLVGGVESHTAIVARSLGLPAVVAEDRILAVARNGQQIIVDGATGDVVINPSAKTLALYRKRKAVILREQKSLRKLTTVRAVTKDGVAIKLMANIELPSEIESILDAGAEGVGLFRSEFMFMNRKDLPSEQEQYEILSKVVRQMQGKPVTIRTLDVGADKLGAALDMKPGPNPALGLRAIRFSLRRKKLLLAQMSAILRASAHGPVRILLPMVSTVDEIREVKKIMARVVGRLKRRGVKLPDPLPALGVMIEIPGAALAADALAAESDFFAIGTNDLTQYTLAIDRTDEQVAYLYNPLHPAVLRLIQFSAEAAAAARIPVSVCGEIAGDHRLTPLLLGFGISELSMAAANLPRVKKRILNLNLSAISGRVRRITSESDPHRLKD